MLTGERRGATPFHLSRLVFHPLRPPPHFSTDGDLRFRAAARHVAVYWPLTGARNSRAQDL